MKAEVKELPLFPLPVVLFPDQTLPLHVFEPRYRVMINRCIENKEPFGVVLVKDDDPDRPYDIGTSASVTQFERLKDGRMNVNTVGVERFRIESLQVSTAGYLIGDVVSYPIDESAPIPPNLIQSLTHKLKRYLTYLARANSVQFKLEQLPKTARDLALFTAVALPIELEQKQDLLETANLIDLLETQYGLLRYEVDMISIVEKAIKPPLDTHIFSRN